MNASISAPLDIKLMNATAVALYGLFVVAMLGTVAAWAMQSSIFAIKKITVVGDVTHTNAVTLRTYVAPRLKGSFVTVDLARARDIFESVPWVRRAVVMREFPNHLKVQLQEHQAVAYWGSESESRLLNDQGEVFEANTGEVEQVGVLPQPQGAVPAPRRGRGIVAIHHLDLQTGYFPAGVLHGQIHRLLHRRPFWDHGALHRPAGDDLDGALGLGTRHTHTRYDQEHETRDKKRVRVIPVAAEPAAAEPAAAEPAAAEA